MEGFLKICQDIVRYQISQLDGREEKVEASEKKKLTIEAIRTFILYRTANGRFFMFYTYASAGSACSNCEASVVRNLRPKINSIKKLVFFAFSL